MKNISFALNIILLLAVGFLYYRDFSGEKSEDNTADNKDTLTQSSVVTVFSGLPKKAPIVFINADTLFAKYEYAKKAKASGEGKMLNYQKSYQTKVEAFQKEYSDYVEKAGAGAYTKEQGTAIEAGLQKKRDEILAMEQNHDKFLEELEKSNADVQKKLYDFFAKFNKEHGYFCVLTYSKASGGILGVNDSLDVTSQVVSALNAEYTNAK